MADVNGRGTFGNIRTLGQASSPIVELRQYTTHLRRRDELIGLFESALIEPQEQTGMAVIGQFTDRDDPDRFVWMRGFADMTSRRRSLEAFYRGPAWQLHRDAANATMVDSDDVLLLRPARQTAAFELGAVRRGHEADSEGRGIVSMAIAHLHSVSDQEQAIDIFESIVAPTIAPAGGSVLGYFVAETSTNDYPDLPIREGESVLIGFAGFTEEADPVDTVRSWSAFTRARLSRWVEHRVLVPTPRSLLDATTPPCRAAAQLLDGAPVAEATE